MIEPIVGHGDMNAMSSRRPSIAHHLLSRSRSCSWRQPVATRDPRRLPKSDLTD